jgi:hypothetical protein
LLGQLLHLILVCHVTRVRMRRFPAFTYSCANTFQSMAVLRTVSTQENQGAGKLPHRPISTHGPYVYLCLACAVYI